MFYCHDTSHPRIRKFSSTVEKDSYPFWVLEYPMNMRVTALVSFLPSLTAGICT